MGGATTRHKPINKAGFGLSPRGRGNRLGKTAISAPNRSIPAWAGQPRVSTNRKNGGRVYPRVGGATVGSGDVGVHPVGLSPRGRGNLTINL